MTSKNEKSNERLTDGELSELMLYAPEEMQGRVQSLVTEVRASRADTGERALVEFDKLLAVFRAAAVDAATMDSALAPLDRARRALFAWARKERAP